MNNLLQAQKKPLFGWYYAWLKLSDIRELQQDIDAGKQQQTQLRSSGTNRIATKVEELRL
eukprot:3431198-Ditylum_brightwellii.AAC.1